MIRFRADSHMPANGHATLPEHLMTLSLFRRPHTAIPLFVAMAMLGSSGLSACAFTDGEPWGWVDVHIESAALPADASSNLISVTMELSSVRVLSETTGQGGGGELDPANPPPGFSLCHNGHCHAADGRLVPYAEVVAESAGGPVVVSGLALEQELGNGESTQARLKIAQRGGLDQAEVELSAMVLEGTLVHQGEAVPFRANVPVRGLRIQANIDLRVDADTPVEQRLDLILELREDITQSLVLADAAFEEDGSLRITNTRNRPLAEELLERAARSLTLLETQR